RHEFASAGLNGGKAAWREAYAAAFALRGLLDAIGQRVIPAGIKNDKTKFFRSCRACHKLFEAPGFGFEPFGIFELCVDRDQIIAPVDLKAVARIKDHGPIRSSSISSEVAGRFCDRGTIGIANLVHFRKAKLAEDLRHGVSVACGIA